MRFFSRFQTGLPQWKWGNLLNRPLRAPRKEEWKKKSFLLCFLLPVKKFWSFSGNAARAECKKISTQFHKDKLEAKLLQCAQKLLAGWLNLPSIEKVCYSWFQTFHNSFPLPNKAGMQKRLDTNFHLLSKATRNEKKNVISWSDTAINWSNKTFLCESNGCKRPFDPCRSTKLQLTLLNTLHNFLVDVVT